MKALQWLAWLLVTLGSLNWLLIGAFHYDFVVSLFHSMPKLIRTTYVIYGIAAIFNIFTLQRLSFKG